MLRGSGRSREQRWYQVRTTTKCGDFPDCPSTGVDLEQKQCQLCPHFLKGLKSKNKEVI